MPLMHKLSPHILHPWRYSFIFRSLTIFIDQTRKGHKQQFFERLRNGTQKSDQDNVAQVHWPVSEVIECVPTHQPMDLRDII